MSGSFGLAYAVIVEALLPYSRALSLSLGEYQTSTSKKRPVGLANSGSLLPGSVKR